MQGVRCVVRMGLRGRSFVERLWISSGKLVSTREVWGIGLTVGTGETRAQKEGLA